MVKPLGDFLIKHWAMASQMSLKKDGPSAKKERLTYTENTKWKYILDQLKASQPFRPFNKMIIS